MNVSVKEHCDAVRDGFCIVRWPVDAAAPNSVGSNGSGGEGPDINVVVTVFGAALQTGDR